MNKKAFTLVELIVVITILAILATVAFISFQWYSQNSRDTVRMTDTKNIEKWLWVYFTKNNIYPLPDDKINILNNSEIVNYQWYAGKNVLNQIWVFGWAVDPISWEYYTYTTNALKNKYQLLSFIENIDNISYFNNHVFASIEDMTPVLKWDKIWTIIHPDSHQPIQTTWVDFEITTSSWDYQIYIDTNNTIQSNQQEIYNILPNSSCFRIKYFQPNAQDGIYEINPDGTPINKYCFMSYISKGLVFNVTWDNSDAKDLTGNFSYELINFNIQSEDSKVWKGIYGQYDSSASGTNITTSPSYIKYSIENPSVWKLKHVTHCQWIQSFNTVSALHSLVGYYYNQDSEIVFRFADRLRQNGITAGSSYEYIPAKISLNDNIAIDNSWHHICRVFDGNNYYLYLDAQEINKLEAAWENKNIEFTREAFSLFFGSDTYDSTRYSVDEIMVFNQALWADEIKYIYDNQK